MDNLRDIWPTWRELADDLGRPYSTVQSWGVRGIPSRYFLDIVAAAQRRGKTISCEVLAGVGRKPEQKRDAA